MKATTAFLAGFVVGVYTLLHCLIEFHIVRRTALTPEEFDALWDAGVREREQGE